MGVYDYHREKQAAGPVTLYEKMPEQTEGNPLKAYVEVVARFTVEGRLLPLSLAWENGKEYEIDRINRIEKLASRKAGGTGICYTCRIRSQEIQLFYELNGLWFVTRKPPAGS